MITHVRVLLVRLSSTAIMKERNSMLKFALIATLIYTKEIHSADDIKKIVRRCKKFYNCYDFYSKPDFCKCDEKCSFYGDCCPSASYITEKVSKPLECHVSGAYMIHRCPNETDGELKQMCEGDPSPHELSTGIPATDASSGLTYRNYYCAWCNGADENNTVFWGAKLSCDITRLEETFHYDNNERRWGLRDNRNVENRFYPCKLQTSRIYISELSDTLRDCHYGLISKCSDDWEDEEVEEKCHTVHAPVFLNSTVIYKNIYCAVCNKVSLSDIKCDPSLFHDGAMKFGEGRGFPSSLEISLDFNAASAQRFHPKCKEGEVQFDNKCRELSCGFPHLVRRNGICVPKTEV